MVVFTIYGQIWVMNADSSAHQPPPALLGRHDQLTTWMQILALEGAARTWEPKRRWLRLFVGLTGVFIMVQKDRHQRCPRHRVDSFPVAVVGGCGFGRLGLDVREGIELTQARVAETPEVPHIRSRGLHPARCAMLMRVGVAARRRATRLTSLPTSLLTLRCHSRAWGAGRHEAPGPGRARRCPRFSSEQHPGRGCCRRRGRCPSCRTRRRPTGWTRSGSQRRGRGQRCRCK